MRFPIIIFFLLGVLTGCERSVRERRSAESESTERPAAIEIDRDSPIDPRALPMADESAVGAIVLCDLSYIGEAQPRSAQHALPAGFIERRLVRCYAPTGEGDLDLLIPEAFHIASGELEEGERIRVKIRSLNGGFEGAPVADLLTAVGRSPIEPPPPPEIAPIAARDSFAPGGPLRVDSIGKCAIAWHGRFRRTPARRSPRYPHFARFSVDVACRSADSEDIVELVFAEEHAIAALGLRRGRIVDLRMLRVEPPSSGATSVVGFAVRDASQ